MPTSDLLVAEGVQTPAEMQQQLATAAKTQAEVPLTQAQTAEAQSRSQLYGAMVGQQQAASDLALAAEPYEKSQLADKRIAEMLAHIAKDDPDRAEKIEAGMEGLANEGVEGAAQWAKTGYTPAVEERLRGLYPSQLTGVAGPATGAQPGQYGLPDNAVDPAQIQLQLSGMNPAQLRAASQKTMGLYNALQAVRNSPNPAQEWDRQAIANGHPEWVGRYAATNGAVLGQKWAEVQPWYNAIQARQTGTEMGVPAPIIPRETKEVGGVLYGVDPAGRSATPLTPDPTTMVGTTGEGQGVYHGLHGGESVGGHTLGPKPGTLGQGSVFQQKQAAWLRLHPGDDTGALNFASGQGKPMSADEILRLADSDAKFAYNQQYGPNSPNLGQPPAEGEDAWESTYRNTRIQEYNALNTAAGGPPPPAGGAAGAPVAGAAPPAGGGRPADQTQGRWLQGFVNAGTWANSNDPAARARGQRTQATLAQGFLSQPTIPSPAPPPAVSRVFREGQITVVNGPGGRQVWTLRNGQPARLY